MNNAARQNNFFFPLRHKGFYVRHNALTVTDVTTITLCRRLEKGEEKISVQGCSKLINLLASGQASDILAL